MSEEAAAVWEEPRQLLASTNGDGSGAAEETGTKPDLVGLAWNSVPSFDVSPCSVWTRTSPLWDGRRQSLSKESPSLRSSQEEVGKS